MGSGGARWGWVVVAMSDGAEVAADEPPPPAVSNVEAAVVGGRVAAGAGEVVAGGALGTNPKFRGAEVDADETPPPRGRRRRRRHKRFPAMVPRHVARIAHLPCLSIQHFDAAVGVVVPVVEEVRQARLRVLFALTWDTAVARMEKRHH